MTMNDATLSPRPLLSGLSRRDALRAAAAAAVGPALVACGGSSTAQSLPLAPADVSSALAAFAQMAPEGSSALVQVDGPSGSWSASHQPQRPMFIGSAFKTFVLAQFMRDVETDRLDFDGECAIDDQHRTGGSPVLGQLSGASTYGSVLEAMMSRSDNTATDIALAQVDVARVRALITSAGLAQTRIPDSARRLLSYLSGAPAGVDIGWDGVVRLATTGDIGYAKRKDVINTEQSIVSTAEDMVRWYARALRADFFAKPATLLQFKRIAGMADRLVQAAPPDTVVYGKPGWIDWEGFHALCLPGQIRVNHVPASFCFILNWQGGSVTSEDRFDEFIAAIAKVLAATAQAIESAGAAGR